MNGRPDARTGGIDLSGRVVDVVDVLANGRGRIRPAWFGLVALLCLTLFFTLMDSTYLFTFDLCLLAVFGAVALNLLQGTAGMVSVGNAAFLAIGAYSSVYCLHVGLTFPADVLIGALVAGIGGLIIGSPAVRLRGLQIFLATLAGHFIVVYLVLQYQRHGISKSSFIVPILYFSKGTVQSEVYWAWTLLGLVCLLILAVTRIVHERAGRAWRMIRDHEIVAHTMGIAVTRYKLTVFVISSVLIGFEGGLLAHFSGSVTVETYTLDLAVSYVVMVVIGGMDSVAGAVIGAFVVTALPVFLPKVISGVLGAQRATQDGPALTVIIYGLLVVLFVATSSNGIVGLFRAAAQRLRTPQLRRD